MKILDRFFNKKKIETMENRNRILKVKLSSMLGDTERLMTFRELKEDYKDYLIIDIKSGENIDIEKLEISGIGELIVRKRDEECC